MLNPILRLVFGVAVVFVLGGCSEDDEGTIDKRTFSPEVQKMRECIHRDGKLTRALDAYLWAIGSYPSTKQGLQALMSRPKGLTDPSHWQGPYLTAENEGCLQDFWGNDYRYAYPGKTMEKKYDLWSMGPDGTDGTDDDVLNWDVR